MEETLDMS
jgi:hypothetical protein